MSEGVEGWNREGWGGKDCERDLCFSKGLSLTLDAEYSPEAEIISRFFFLCQMNI